MRETIVSGNWYSRALAAGVALGLVAVSTVAAVEAKASEPDIAKGRELARKYCTACHLLPDPSLHDKATWFAQVKPLMHRNAGMAALNPEGAPEEQQALAEWAAIWRYYEAAAPTVPLPQPPHEAIHIGLPGFVPENPRYRQGISYATMVRIDAARHEIHVGNAFTHSLDVLDAQGRGRASTRIDSTLTGLTPLPEGTWLGAQIGMVVPDDRPLGRLTRFTRPGPAFRVAGDVLTGLVRPIEAAVGEFNGDGRPDIVVCSYGNRTGVSGKLAWYESLDGNAHEEHLLFDRPGAIRCFVRDVNGDGRDDIVALMAQAKEGVFLLRNEGGGEFTRVPLVERPPAWGYADLELADFNDDGRPDLVTANGDLGDFDCPPKAYHGVRIHLNQGENRFREAFFYPLHGAYGVEVADFDLDGDPDVAAIAFFPDYARAPEESFVLFENRGDLRFTPRSFPDCQRGRWLTMDAGDLDGDGDADIVLGAAFKTPFRVPPELKARWDREGPSLLILRNQARTPRSAKARP